MCNSDLCATAENKQIIVHKDKGLGERMNEYKLTFNTHTHRHTYTCLYVSTVNELLPVLSSAVSSLHPLHRPKHSEEDRTTTAGRRCGRFRCCACCRYRHDTVLIMCLLPPTTTSTTTATTTTAATQHCLGIGVRTLPTIVGVAKSTSGGETAAAAALWCCPGHGTLGRREHHATWHDRVGNAPVICLEILGFEYFGASG